jgi:aryl-alcohol dehydrogenase-like predicted oxidoreductase
MQKRKIGHSEIEVGPWAFGGNVLGWTADETTSFELLDGFAAAGFNLIDTADVYSRWVQGHNGGESERMLGKWLKRSGKRHQVVIATKVGKEMGPESRGLSRAYIVRAVEASLKRLQTDYIDLYQSHEEDANTPIEETLEAYGQLIRDGKVRIIGASNYNADALARAVAAAQEGGWPSYQSLQPLYNLYDREGYETGMDSLCRKLGLSVFPYFSLASGFLTGKYRSEKDLAASARGQMVRKYLDDRGFRVLEALDQVAEQYHSKPARVSLAWLLAQPGVTAPIASATNISQLEDLIAATQLKLDDTALRLLHEASAY